jgi:hypothetical protein
LRIFRTLNLGRGLAVGRGGRDVCHVAARHLGEKIRWQNTLV